MKRAISLIGVALALSACYRYVVESAPQPSVGAEYRAHLTPSGSATLAPYLGREVQSFEGRILSASDTAYFVSVAQTASKLSTRPTIWAGEQMTIPRETILRFERKELDRKRSVRYAALYTAGALLAGSIWFSISGRASASGDPGPGPITP